MANLKEVPEGNKGLSKLPTKVRNRMGFLDKGSQIKKAPTKGTSQSATNFDKELQSEQKAFEAYVDEQFNNNRGNLKGN